MKFPISPDTPEDRLAHAIAKELVIEGFDSMLALPVAISLMAAINHGHDDPMKAVEYLGSRRKKSDEWWVKYHPKTNMAKSAKARLKAAKSQKNYHDV